MSSRTVKRWSSGGRSLKRAHLRKVKSVSYPCQASIGNPVEQPDVAPLGVKRRARTSAAMIGLALSMGATGLLLPRQDDGAAAAEPKVPDTAIAATLPVAESASQVDMSSSTTPVPTVQVVEHTVREGQTLQQIAEQYRISAWSIAAANSLTLNATLKAGQVLRIPNPDSVSAQMQTEVDAAVRPSPSPLVASANLNQLPSVNDGAPDDALVTERNSALDRLQQQRDKLRDSLAELRYEESNQVASLPRQDVEASGQLETESLDANTANVSPIAAEQPVVPSPSPFIATVPDAQPVPSPSVVNALVDEQAVQPSTTQFETQPQTSFSQTQVYRVNPGDTIAAIARAHNIPQSLLINANQLSNPNVIFVGQELTLPSLQPTVPDAPVQIAFADTSAPLPAVTSGLSVSTAPAPKANTPSVENSDLTAQLEVPSSDQQPTSRQVAVAPMSDVEINGDSVPSLPENLDPSDRTETVSGANPYVENLLSEIRALRQRQQPSVAVSTVESSSELAPISAPTVSASEVAVSPHFNRSGMGGQDTATLQNAATLAVQGQPAQEQRSAQDNASSDASDPELVAAAPLGSESYAPLLQPVTGRMVSPDLPPLPGADTFLPEDGVFDGYIWPARGLLTSGYGWRWGRMHQGIDIAADIGTPIYAAADGVVEYAGWNSGGYGNMVEIRHSDGSMTRYAHMNAIYVQTGQRLGQGDQLGEMGSTGYSTGPHLHFEVHLPDQGTVNPMAYLPQ